MHTAVRAGTRHRLTARERAGLLLHALAAARADPRVPAARAAVRLGPAAAAGGACCALATIAIFHDVPLSSGIHFDATTALALIATALVGPLPALAVIFPPIAVNALCGRERLMRVGNLANLAAYGWYTLAGALLLQAPRRPAARRRRSAGCVAAGVVQLLVNWALAPAIYGTLWLGHPLRALRRDAARRAARRHR